MMSEDTIAAISTAMSPSGIGIVRISGPGAIETARKIYRSPGGKKRLENVPSHTIHYGYIYDRDVMADEVLVMVMRGPRSYTGEDTVEINCHGVCWRCAECWRQCFTPEPGWRIRENLPSARFSTGGLICLRRKR